jgi:hypothetical protein
VLCFTERSEDNADVKDCMSSRGSSGGMWSSVGRCNVCIAQCCALPGRIHSELCKVVAADCRSSAVRHSLTHMLTSYSFLRSVLNFFIVCPEYLNFATFSKAQSLPRTNRTLYRYTKLLDLPQLLYSLSAYFNKHKALVTTGFMPTNIALNGMKGAIEYYYYYYYYYYLLTTVEL